MVIAGDVPEGAAGSGDGPAEEVRAEFEPPRGPVEAVLALMWGDVLGVERVGMRDNFFALGGDASRAERLAVRVRVALGVELPPAVIFREPTLAGQALAVAGLLLQRTEAGASQPRA
jgi:hypothetical protein